MLNQFKSARFRVPEGQAGTLLTFHQIVVNSQRYGVDLIEFEGGSNSGSRGLEVPWIRGRSLPD